MEMNCQKKGRLTFFFFINFFFSSKWTIGVRKQKVLLSWKSYAVSVSGRGFNHCHFCLISNIQTTRLIWSHSLDQIVGGSRFSERIAGCAPAFWSWDLNLFMSWSYACNPTPNILSTHLEAPTPLHLFADRLLAERRRGRGLSNPSSPFPWCLSTNWATSWDRGQTGKGGMHGKRPLRQASVRVGGGGGLMERRRGWDGRTQIEGGGGGKR